MSDFSGQSPQGYVPPNMGYGYMPPEDPYAKRVGFGKRLGAYLIDFVIMMVINFALQNLLGINAQAEAIMAGMNPDGSDMLDLLMQTLQLSLPVYLLLLAYTLVEAFVGASPGKLILKITVGSDDGQPGSIGLYGIRWFIKTFSYLLFILGIAMSSFPILLIAMLPMLVFFIGCFFALGEKKQALHDMLAKTAIFHKSDLVPADESAPQAAV